MFKLYRRLLMWLIRLDPEVSVVAIITKKEIREMNAWVYELEKDMHLPPIEGKEAPVIH